MTQTSVKWKRPFGVELEFNSAPHPQVILWSLHRLGYKASILMDDSRHTKPNHWIIKEDSSITGRSHCLELSSPILRGNEGLAKVRKVCKLLQHLGCKVNSSCGLHVHISRMKLSPRVTYTMFMRYGIHEDEIDSWMAKGRQKSKCSSCKSHKKDADFLMALYEHPIERKYMLDVDGYNDILHMLDGNKISVSTEYPTWEFRHHYGTLEPTEVSNWVRFCLNFVKTSAELTPTTRRQPKTKDRGPLMGLPTFVRKHFHNQTKRFQ